MHLRAIIHVIWSPEKSTQEKSGRSTCKDLQDPSLRSPCNVFVVVCLSVVVGVHDLIIIEHVLVDRGTVAVVTNVADIFVVVVVVVIVYPYLFLFSTQVFTALFAAEIVFRLVAMGPMAFIRSRWNVFDTTVVSGSLLGYFYKSAEGLSIFRTLRLVRT